MNDLREVTEQVRDTDEARTNGFLPCGLRTAQVLPHKQQIDPGRPGAQPSPAMDSLETLITCPSLWASVSHL